MPDKKPKVLYIFAGERRKKEELRKRGEYPDTEFWGMNHLKDFGIEAEYIENKIINFIRKKSFNLFNLFYIFKIRKYDVVFLGGSLSLVFFAKVILRFANPKVIFFNTYLTNLLKRNRKGIKAMMVRRAIKSIYAIICPSRAQKEFLIKEGFSGEKIYFVPAGIDVDFFDSSPETQNTNKERFILSVGKDMGRDYKTLVEAVKNIDIKVKIVAFPRNVVGIDLPSNASIQVLPFIELLSLYRNCEFVVIPTKKQENIIGSDCSGHLVLLDAMAAGKAIIASDRDTLKEYIADGAEGLIVKPENVGELRKAIQKLLDNPQMAQDMGRRAKEKARRELTTKIFAQNLTRIFLETAKQ